MRLCHCFYNKRLYKQSETFFNLVRVSDPHFFFADPDPDPGKIFHADPDPVPDPDPGGIRGRGLGVKGV